MPDRDTNNWQPRLGFNWNPRTESGGPIGWFTGGDKFVVRGGFARTHDYAFLNLALNVATAFPYIGAVNAPRAANAFARLPAIAHESDLGRLHTSTCSLGRRRPRVCRCRT